MTTKISPQAFIHEHASLGEGVVVEPFSYIGPNVTIGARTYIGPNVTILESTTIGTDCKIFPGGNPIIDLMCYQLYIGVDF